MPDQISASHILLMHSESERSSATRTKSEAVDLINNIKTRVGAGDDFNDLAKRGAGGVSSMECPPQAFLQSVNFDDAVT